MASNTTSAFTTVQLSNVQLPAKVVTKIGDFAQFNDKVRFCEMTTTSIREMSGALNHWTRWSEEKRIEVLKFDQNESAKKPASGLGSFSNSQSIANPQLIRQVTALAKISCVSYEEIFELFKTYTIPTIGHELIRRDEGIEKFIQMADQVDCEEKRKEILSIAFNCSTIPLEEIHALLSTRKDRAVWIKQIISERGNFSVYYCARLFLDLLKESDFALDRLGVIQAMIQRIGLFDGDEEYFDPTIRQLRQLLEQIEDPENFLSDFMHLGRHERGYTCYDSRAGESPPERERFAQVVFKVLKEKDPTIIHKVVRKEGGLQELLKIIGEIPYEHDTNQDKILEMEMLGDALSCPEISFDAVHDFLKTQKAKIEQNRRRGQSSPLIIKDLDHLAHLLQIIICDRKGLSFEEAFLLLEDLRIFPSEKMIHSLMKSEGGLDKLLARVDKEKYEHNKKGLLEKALSLLTLPFQDALKIVGNSVDKLDLLFYAFRGLTYEHAIQCFDLFHSFDDREKIAKLILNKFDTLSVQELQTFLEHIPDSVNFFTNALKGEGGLSDPWGVVVNLSVLLPELVKGNSKYTSLEEMTPLLIDQINSSFASSHHAQVYDMRSWRNRTVTFSEYLKDQSIGQIGKIALKPDTTFGELLSIATRFGLDKYTVDWIVNDRPGLLFDEALKLMNLFKDQPEDLYYIGERILNKFGIFPFHQVISLLDSVQNPKKIIDSYREMGTSYNPRKLLEVKIESIFQLQQLLEESPKYKELAKSFEQRLARPYFSVEKRDRALKELVEKSGVSVEQLTHIANKISDPELKNGVISGILKTDP